MLWTPQVKVSCDCECCRCCDAETVIDLERVPDSRTFWTELDVAEKLREEGWKVFEEGDEVVTISPYCEVPERFRERKEG